MTYNKSTEKPNDDYILALLQYIMEADSPVRLYQIMETGKDPDYFVVDNSEIISTFNGKPYVLTQEQNNYDYDRIKIRNDWYSVHRLVAEAFCSNPNPEVRTEIHHIDNNRHNNHYWNLRYIDPFTHDLYHIMKKRYKVDVEL